MQDFIQIIMTYLRSSKNVWKAYETIIVFIVINAKNTPVGWLKNKTKNTIMETSPCENDLSNPALV